MMDDKGRKLQDKMSKIQGKMSRLNGKNTTPTMGKRAPNPGAKVPANLSKVRSPMPSAGMRTTGPMDIAKSAPMGMAKSMMKKPGFKNGGMAAAKKGKK